LIRPRSSVFRRAVRQSASRRGRPRPG